MVSAFASNLAASFDISYDILNTVYSFSIGTQQKRDNEKEKVADLQDVTLGKAPNENPSPICCREAVEQTSPLMK